MGERMRRFQYQNWERRSGIVSDASVDDNNRPVGANVEGR
jgi:hypothetical protein